LTVAPGPTLHQIITSPTSHPEPRQPGGGFFEGPGRIGENRKLCVGRNAKKGYNLKQPRLNRKKNQFKEFFFAAIRIIQVWAEFRYLGHQ